MAETPLTGVIERLRQASAADFASAPPFPHLALDGLFPEGLIDQTHRSVMALGAEDWDKTADAGIEVKCRSRWQSEQCIPEPARDIVRLLNSGPFLRELSRMSGIPHLVPDPYFTGGGFNLLRTGGMLDVHVDGNWHDEMGLHRRLNVILYLNRNWREEWNGHLGFFDNRGEREVVSIAPIGNRLLIFETHDFTYHGQPKPIRCPDDEGRTSIILYYYTAAARPSAQVLEMRPHSALWRSKGWMDKRGHRIRA